MKPAAPRAPCHWCGYLTALRNGEFILHLIYWNNPDPGGRVMILCEGSGMPMRTCRVCGCTDEDSSVCIAKTGYACSWVDKDLCSTCSTPEQVVAAKAAALTSMAAELGISEAEVMALQKQAAERLAEQFEAAAVASELEPLEYDQGGDDAED